MRTPGRSLTLVDLEPASADLKSEVFGGLGSDPKTLPCKLLYDKRGSDLFDQITELPEYYPTRTEIAIMREYLPEIAAAVGPRVQLVELGSGSSIKTQVLLDALDEPASYVPIDISRDPLWQSAERIHAGYPNLSVQPLCAYYLEPFDVPEPEKAAARRVVFFPGSTIGNFDMPDALAFLDRIADLVGVGGGLLIGVDLRKRADVLEAAYDDARGVTAEFSLNLLHRLNREAGADFDVGRFRHRSAWNGELGRVEMHLVSQVAQCVTVAGKRFDFGAGETIHIESAYKYRVSEFAALAPRFRVEEVWTDERGLFSVQYLVVRSDGSDRGGRDAGTGAGP